MANRLHIWQNTIRVNNATDGHQFHPEVVGLSNGNILVVWADANDETAPSAGYDIMGQIYDPLGQPVGAAIQLNDGYGSNRSEYSPQIAATADGGFVVSYDYYSSDQYDHLYRRFDADGMAAGQQGYVVDDAAGGTTYTDFDTVHRPDGSSVVTYRRDAGTDEDLVARIIGADGSVSGEIQIRYDQDPSGNTQGDPDNPVSAVLADGRVVVAFMEEDNNVYGVEYSVLNTDGTVSMQGNVDYVPGVRQSDADVAALADGGFVITWLEENIVKAQILNSDLTKRGETVDIAPGDDVKADPQVVMLKDGGFAVGWIDRTDKELSVKIFDADGVQIGPKQDIPFVGFDARELDMGTSADGRILVTWRSYTNENYDDSDVLMTVLDPRLGVIEVTDGTPTTASPLGSDIWGSAADDTFFGLDGNDDFDGRGGDDSLFGGRGDDEIGGGHGADVIEGGRGRDELSGGRGSDRVEGGSAADKIWGNAGHDRLDGDGGHDKIWGGSGRDLIRGGDGADVIWGNGGADKLRGNAGNDIIIGGTGRDLMLGDRGADTFVFSDVRHSGTTAETRDVILDFQHGRDVIDLRGIDADTTRSGNQAFEFIGTDRFDDEGQLRARVANGDIYLQADRDGDGRADFEIKLESPGVIDSFDFLL